MKRNYSHDDLQKWDRKKMPMPPLTPMTGIGRYRHSISADPAWKVEHFRKQQSGLYGLEAMVSSCGSDLTGDTSVSSEEWQQISNSTRRDSAISSTSTRTTSSTGLADLSRTQSAPRLTRGFSPPTTPFRGSFGMHSRKGSNLSFVCRPEDLETAAAQNSAPERRSSNPLATIKELHSTQVSTDKLKKVERPCDFTGDPESAVASDADEEDDSAWTDEPESARPSALSQMVKDGKKVDLRPALEKPRTMSDDKKRARGSTTALDRSRTVRGAQSQTRRRKSSKHAQIPLQRTKSEEKKPEKVIVALPSPESTSDDSPVVLQMHKPAKGATRKHVDSTHTKDGTLLAENEKEYLPRAPRNRSATVLRCGTGALSPPMFAQQAI